MSDVGHLALDALANDVELALERVLVHPRRPADEQLLDVRLRHARRAADGVHVDRGVAPAEHLEPLLPDDPLDDPFDQQALLSLDRQEGDAAPVLAPRRAA